MTERDKLPAKPTITHTELQTGQAKSEKSSRDALDAFFAFTSRGDFEQALKLANNAVERGDAQGYYVLGFIYSFSGDETRNYVLAHMWTNLAAQSLSLLDTKPSWRDDAIKQRVWLEQRMTAAEISKAWKLAHDWRIEQHEEY